VSTERDLRASDAERSATADLLRRHHAEGRLDTAELEERIERCYAAKTRGELDALTDDLPGPHLDRRSSQGRRYRPFIPVAFFPLLVLVVVLSVTTGAHVLWLVWPLAFFTFARFRMHRGRSSV
jgi:Domain of unknown function (DUF1707)